MTVSKEREWGLVRLGGMGKVVVEGRGGWMVGSSENWRLQFGDLRVFMESNRPPSLAEGP